MEKRDRKVALWGAGQMCLLYLEHGLELEPVCVIDNDKRKSGLTIKGIPILSPEKIKDWSEYYIVIISQYEKEIRQQLEHIGLTYKSDFIGIQELHMQNIPMEVIADALQESFLNDNLGDCEVEAIVRNMEQYEQVVAAHRNCMKYEETLGHIYYRLPGKTGSYRGYCSACGENRNFIVDYFWSKGKMPAWRETVTCPECHCNSRMRFVIDYVKRNYKEKKIFMYEKITCTYKAMEQYVADLTGSEYLSDELKSGEMKDGILHEDALALSFGDETWDVMVSNDVFEHVADYTQALKEAYRCLKPGGRLLVTIPIFKNRYKTVQRVSQDHRGNLRYLMTPEYHGNPLSGEGSLVFYEFGWDFLESLRECGFSDAYGIVYFSADKGYFGEMPVGFEAVK